MTRADRGSAHTAHQRGVRRMGITMSSRSDETQSGRLTLRRDLNSLFDGTCDLGSRLFGVFPRRERQRDERPLVLAADAEAVARPRDAAGKRHRHNLAHLAILVRRHRRLLFLGRDPQDHISVALAVEQISEGWG